MKKELSRREFLKIAGLMPFGLAAPRLFQKLDTRAALQEKPQNVIVFVFDAFSALEISTYGYGRKTTPNIDRLSKQAIVYHNHYASGSFTSPGTASLLTGTLPWTNRAFRPNSEVAQSFISQSVFDALPNHYRIAYTHNGWAFTLLRQFRHAINELIPKEDLLLNSYSALIPSLFRNDDDIASVSWERVIRTEDDGYAYSLFLSKLFEAYDDKRNREVRSLFPRGIPAAGAGDFLLETAIEAIAKRLSEIPQPFMGYFHMLPPHAPYRTSQEFYNTFKDDNFQTIKKPIDIFGTDKEATLVKARRDYDEFILYCDKEFGRLYDLLESSGTLDNTWLILTSDHGEMNERGLGGHMVDSLYQPLVRVPLIIFEPGRKTGMEVHEYTSAVDIVPTVAHLVGEPRPNWTEGVVLPPFAPAEGNLDRSIYLLRASHNDQYAPLTIASTMLVRESYKLHYYFGYPEVPPEGLVRLFDVKSDPEEMSDLVQSKPAVAAELLNELKNKLKEVNAPYL